MKRNYRNCDRHFFRCAGDTTLEARTDPASGPKDGPGELLSECGSQPSGASLRTVTSIVSLMTYASQRHT